MGRLFFVILVLFLTPQSTFCQHSFSGKLLDASSKNPVEFATIATSDNNFWAVTNNNGEFRIDLPQGEFSLVVSCLGYEKTTIKVTIKDQSVYNQIYYIRKNSLALKEVIVTAQKEGEELSTTYTIDRNALFHAQMKDISELIAQLPGEQTDFYNTTLAREKPQEIILRSGSTNEMDNPAIGTAIEIDGMRLSSNANFSSYASDGIEGINVMNIAVNNIESVEIVTGLPSVEEGDLTAGLIKIHTRKGKAPYEIEVVSKPKIKSYSVTKGFDLGEKKGIINTSLEHTRSIKERVSPYTIYSRNNISLTYRNTFGNKERPIDLIYGVTGNFGGYDSESDPDLYVDTYEKQRDYVLRTNLNMKCLLNLPWITGVDFMASANYADRKGEEKDYEVQSASTASIHTTDEGYFITQDYDENSDAPIISIPSGNWYELKYDDDKPITYSAKLKANWVKKKEKIVNTVKVGGEFSFAGNYGKGIYYDDMRYAPTWREYRYKDQPFVKTYSFYAEDKVKFPLWARQMKIQAGIRSDITSINGSDYGTVQGWSPRVNAQYMLYKNDNTLLKSMKIHAGWGDAIKLPSASVLFPRPSYIDILAFNIAANTSGTEQVYAYYTIPLTTIYNSDLKWQRRRKLEIGVDLKLKNTKIFLTAFRDKTFHPYKKTGTYVPFSYKYTELADCEIPLEDREYSIDSETGVITVSDNTGTYDSETLDYTIKNTFKKNSYYTNGSPVIRKGFEWIVDFGKIEALKTSVRIDGSYYYYKGVDQTIVEYSPSTLSVDGSPYKYVGFYVGSTNSSSFIYNGSESKKINTNVTLTTHVPAIRMIVSCRIEACLYDYSRNLSEYSGGTRSYVLDELASYVPSSDNESIYEGNHYVATYPLYYKSIDDMDTEIPFLEKFLWAKENDGDLYNDLTTLVKKTSNSYFFKAKKYSPYFSANINLTKEIGDHFSITFKATNFFNNTGRITNSQTDNETSLYKNSKIASFYYGLSMRLKL